MYSVLASPSDCFVLLEEGLGWGWGEWQVETAVSLSTAIGFAMLFLNPKLCPLFCGLELSGSNANINYSLALERNNPQNSQCVKSILISGKQKNGWEGLGEWGEGREKSDSVCV